MSYRDIVAPDGTVITEDLIGHEDRKGYAFDEEKQHMGGSDHDKTEPVEVQSVKYIS